MINLNSILEEIRKIDLESIKRENVILGRAVRRKFKENFNGEVKFLDKTTLLISTDGMSIPIPNQYFKLGAIVSPLYANLKEAREEVIRILNDECERNGEIVFGGNKYKKKENFKTLFPKIKKYYEDNIKAGKKKKEILDNIKNELGFIETSSKRESDVDNIIEFIADYSSWGGGRTLDRTSDYTGSAISTVLNMQQTSSEIILKVIETIVKCNIVDEILLKNNVNEVRNLIVFGAPGTGKSHYLDERTDIFTKTRRVTFHGKYTYGNFVGAYKPFSKGVDIVYKFVEGPFIKTIIDAINNPDKNYLLIIEELNRANPATVFGDMFQLLDRNSVHESKYSIEIPDELTARFEEVIEMEMQELRIPANMYIWATMNPADQGVAFIDSAFKRRWDFEYIGIDDKEGILTGKEDELILHYPDNSVQTIYSWNNIRKKINSELKGNVNEDKLLGPFFIKPSKIVGNHDKTFKSKVLMYLYEDVLRHGSKNILFEEEFPTYSSLLEAYDRGEKIFKFDLE